LGSAFLGLLVAFAIVLSPGCSGADRSAEAAGLKAGLSTAGACVVQQLAQGDDDPLTIVAICGAETTVAGVDAFARSLASAPDAGATVLTATAMRAHTKACALLASLDAGVEACAALPVDASSQ
jgi:hypothetical protein